MKEKKLKLIKSQEAEDPRVYEEREEEEGFNKGSHAKRSVGNDERKNGHRKFFKRKLQNNDQADGNKSSTDE